MKYCILVRYTAQYSDVVKKLLEQSEIYDCIFTDNVEFMNVNSGTLNLWPQKSIALILIVDDEQLVLLEKNISLTVYDSEILKNKIRYFVIPVYKEN